MIHAEVDPRRCCGYRLCVDAAPGVFAINPAGKAESVVVDISGWSRGRGPCGSAGMPFGSDHDSRCRTLAVTPETVVLMGGDALRERRCAERVKKR